VRRLVEGFRESKIVNVLCAVCPGLRKGRGFVYASCMSIRPSSSSASSSASFQRSGALRFDPALAHRYLQNLDSVSGWLHAFSAEVILAVSAFQNERVSRGAVAEIGVHHGKLFLLLYLTTKAGEPAMAIDVFSQQHLNVDKSGHGDKSVFLRQCRKWAGNTDGLSIIEDSSLNLTPREIIENVGTVRLFSIDGGHSEEATANDMALALSVLTDEGVIIIDDCFNEYWPEVVAAVARYLSENDEVVPFAITPGKVFLCRKPMKALYENHLREKFSRRVDKTARLFGHTVPIIGVLPMTIRRALGRTPMGNKLKQLIH
jgi:hypothetical protein